MSLAELTAAHEKVRQAYENLLAHERRKTAAVLYVAVVELAVIASALAYILQHLGPR